MSSGQPKPTGEKQSRPLQILVYTPQSGGTKGPPQTSEVFDVGGSCKDGAGGSRALESTTIGNGETLGIPEYTTHIIRPSPSSSSTPEKSKGQYHQPVTAAPAAQIYPHYHYAYPDAFLHLYLSHEEPTLPLPLPPHPIPPPPQQPPEFAIETMAIPPISEEEWNMLNSPESSLEEMLGPNLGTPAVMEELLETCLPLDSTDEGRQWWHELLSVEGDGEGFWTRFLGGDGGVVRGEAGWGVNGEGEVQGGDTPRKRDSPETIRIIPSLGPYRI
ncbi:hypothetical protein C7212DRAFT_345965 [Tuber magnatum]|uniref:Uncharacterized protein n=1 Tax=Tuber magnatum TaxID=42249 RepID=A0A317SLB0_9PEZI|nr:hypothetical protein C7212DRAFT_345965 [Tuber magnatum]